MIWTVASQRLWFSKPPVTSGDHGPAQRYQLRNSQSHIRMFSCSITPHVRRRWAVICWAAESGRERQWCCTAGVVMLKGHCLKVLAQLQHRDEAQAYHKAQWARQSFLPCDLTQHTVLHVTLTGSSGVCTYIKLKSLRILKNMVFGFNSKGRQQFCPQTSICTYI